MNDINYHDVVAQAQVFKDLLTSDHGYDAPGSNALALECMIIGWIYAQRWFAPFQAETLEEDPEADVHERVHDITLQAFTDVAASDPLFNQESTQRIYRPKDGAQN